MTIRELSIVLGILLIGTNVPAQHYFIVNSDTTFCAELEYTTTAQGYLKSIKYTDDTGEEVYIKGRKKVPDVQTFYIHGVSIDKIPLKAHKPDSYIRYTERVVDGKLKVYLARQGYNSTMQLRSTPGFADDYTT